MKKITLLIILCLALFGQAQAQRYLPNQKGIQFNFNAVDGFYLDKQDKQAFSVGMAFSQYTKNGNRWVFGGEYLQKSYEYKDLYIPLSQFTAEGGYYLNFISDKSKTLFFSVGLSALAGYETINWGKEVLKDGASINSEDNFLYGCAATFEVEIYLTDKLVLLLNARERFLPTSSVNDFHTQFGIGFKCIIN